MRLNVVHSTSLKSNAASKTGRRTLRSSATLRQQNFSDLLSDCDPDSVQNLDLHTASSPSFQLKTQKKSSITKRMEKTKFVKKNMFGENETSRDVEWNQSPLLDDLRSCGKEEPMSEESPSSGGSVLESPSSIILAASQRSFELVTLPECRVLGRTCPCTTIGRKRVVGVDDVSQDFHFNSDCSSPSTSSSSEFTPRKRFASPRTPLNCCIRRPIASLVFDNTPKELATPCTPPCRITFFPDPADVEVECGGESFLEEIPFDLLLRIVCCLQHHDLQPVSMVCKRLLKAVSIAWKYHFSFTTPHRKKTVKAAQGGLASSSVRPPTPNAPRQRSRPSESRLSGLDIRPFAPPLFQQEQPVVPVPPRLRKSKTKRLPIIASHRVLFNEDELCQAVAQNSL